MLLVKKFTSGAIDQAGVGSSRHSHSVSIKLLDDNGERVVEDDSECYW